jgi:hypothetical protein
MDVGIGLPLFQPFSHGLYSQFTIEKCSRTSQRVSTMCIWFTRHILLHAPASATVFPARRLLHTRLTAYEREQEKHSWEYYGGDARRTRNINIINCYGHVVSEGMHLLRS